MFSMLSARWPTFWYIRVICVSPRMAKAYVGAGNSMEGYWFFFLMGHWMDGVRDGNPHVVEQTLRLAMTRQSEAALRHYLYLPDFAPLGLEVKRLPVQRCCCTRTALIVRSPCRIKLASFCNRSTPVLGVGRKRHFAALDRALVAS